MQKLDDAVRAMSNGGHANKNLTPIMTNKQLTDGEVSAIVAFLKALDCNQKLEVPKKAPVVTGRGRDPRPVRARVSKGNNGSIQQVGPCHDLAHAGGRARVRGLRTCEPCRSRSSARSRAP